MYEALKQDTDYLTALQQRVAPSCDKQMQTLRMVAENILVTPLMIALSHVFITWICCLATRAPCGATAALLSGVVSIVPVVPVVLSA